jgi:hypothetical protein
MKMKTRIDHDVWAGRIVDFRIIVHYATTQPPQQPPAPSSGPLGLLKEPGAPGGPLCWPGRPVCCSCSETLVPLWRRQEERITYLVVLPNLPYEVCEGFINIDALLCRRLDELAVEMLGKITTLCIRAPSVSQADHLAGQRTIHSYLTFIFQVTLVRNNDDWELVHIFDPQNLLVECADFLERVPGRDRVDQEEALASTHVLLAHRTTESVKHIQGVKQRRAA